MRLESLHIDRNVHGFEYAGLRPNEVGGTIKFSGTNGSTVQVKLKPHHIEQMLAIVAGSMVEHTRELATELTTQIIEHAAVPALAAEVA